MDGVYETGNGAGCRSRRVRYNSPSDKDPLVSGLEYKTIEWGLKKGLSN